MKRLFRRVFFSDSWFDDVLAIVRGAFFINNPFKILLSRKVYFKNQGRIVIDDGRLCLGFLTNRLGMDPSGRGVFRVYKGGTCEISGFVRIARTAKIYVSGRLRIGDGTYINPNSIIVANNSVSIGRGCAISWNCQILDNDMHVIEGSMQDEVCNGITIKDNVWIGTNCIILKGVTIGAGSVVAAGSVVTRSVDPKSLYAGVPARKVKNIGKWK